MKSKLQNPIWYAIMFEVMIGDSSGICIVTMIDHNCTGLCSYKERT